MLHLVFLAYRQRFESRGDDRRGEENMRSRRTARRRPTTAEERALNHTISQIEKAFGAGAIMKLGEGSTLEIEGDLHRRHLARPGPRRPWPAQGADHRAVRAGVERQDDDRAARRGQRPAERRVAAFIDVEHALDPSWCKRLGVNIESLLVSQPASAEEALQIAEMLVLSNAVDIIVIDSVAALVPKVEVEGEIGDSFTSASRPG